MRRTIPTSKTLQTSYIKNNYESKLELLKDIVKNFESFYVMFDEADYNGKKYFTFLVGELGSEPKPPYLIEITVGHQAIEIMEKPDIIARIGYVHNVEFLCGFITESEARNYTIPKAEIVNQKMTEKLIDLANLEP